MLKLRGHVSYLGSKDLEPRLLQITENIKLPHALRSKYALLISQAADWPTNIPEGFGAVLLRKASILQGTEETEDQKSEIYLLPEDYGYLMEGDIVRLSPRTEHMSVVFRRGTPNNSILLTERCNHYCLMCSQPPKNSDDGWLLEEAFELIWMLPGDTENIGFTGGEPTLYGDGFISLVAAAKANLPNTSLDVLSNGRSFANEEFAKKLAAVAHPNFQIGIPLYSDDPVTHDYVVQSNGAYDETLQGILNLKRFGIRVEIRIVIHQQTLPRLVQTCEFISRNLLFVDHVALMGLEITGFTRANLDILWADPYHYRDTLSQAVYVLRTAGMNVSVYNHQLCVINKDIEKECRKAISDWKNEYLPVCDGCTEKAKCGGFFSTQIMYKHSEHIKPFN